MLKRFRFGGQDSVTNPNPNIIRLAKITNPNPNIRDSEEKIRIRIRIRIFVTTLMFRIRFEPSLCPRKHRTLDNLDRFIVMFCFDPSIEQNTHLHSTLNYVDIDHYHILVWFDLYNIFLIIYIFWISSDLETRTPPLHTFCRSRVRKRVTNLEAAESGHILISMATKVHSKVAFQFYAQDVNKRTFIWNTKYTKLKV